MPNWAATVMGITPDMIGLFGNRNYGTVAYDNIFRKMKARGCELDSRSCITPRATIPITIKVTIPITITIISPVLTVF